MNYRPEILEYLSTPLTWAFTEILAIALFFYCLADILKKNEGNSRLFRVFELFGFIVYAGIFENIGVIGNIYNYSLNRLLMVGTVPLSILMLEAVIFYSALRFAEIRGIPKWAIPLMVGMLGVLQDLTIDPVAVFDLHLVEGVMEGRWNWTVNYKDMLFGIPFFNYTGWFLLMFYYSIFIQLGRWIYEKSGQRFIAGISYVLLSPIAGVLLIVSPITRFLMFLDPLFPMFTNRSAELYMLSFAALISILIVIRFRKKSGMRSFKDDPVVWLIPIILHAYDIILAFSLQITTAYIPVLLFAGIHLGYLAYYLGPLRFRFRNRNMVPA
ncbi:MAG: hypothetical protein KAH21_02185 [Spirochaetaceae bacterium]|nr:hypothetical protein [Spirochaetaceae bacterium]